MDLNAGIIGIKTKAELKRRIAAGEDLLFYSTDAFSNVRSIRLNGMLVGDHMYVVGPDPYRNRKWYADVTRNSDGKVTVK